MSASDCPNAVPPVGPLRAITLDLDDTLWPMLPVRSGIFSRGVKDQTRTRESTYELNAPPA